MLTDRLAVLRPPRSGGKVLEGVLRRLPKLLIYAHPDHGTYDEYEAICEEVGIQMPPAVTIVRNPWSWYVERWCRQRSHPREGFTGSFAEYLEEMWNDAARFHSIRTQTWCLVEWLGAYNCSDVMRFENLYEEIVRIVLAYAKDRVKGVYGACGQGPVMQMSPEQIVRHFISQEWHYRPALTPDGDPPGDYREYYTEENQQWVKEWDSALIENYGYTFD